MNTRKFAQIAGVVFLVIGVFGLAQGLSTFPEWLPVLQISSGYGVFLDLIPMNIINKLLYIGFGVAGLVVAQPRFSAEADVRYSKTVFYTFGLLAVLGLFQYTSTLFGVMPLMRGAVLAHAVFAGAAAYFAFKHGELPSHEQLA
jgi:hypothetical protein